MSIAGDFHKLYDESRVWSGGRTRWLGVAVQKCPLDLWVYQEILCRLRPDLIVETGTAAGGSALFLATICESLGHGRIISVDIRQQTRPRHDRIEYLTGSSVSADVLRVVVPAAKVPRVMVVLDSDHSKAHVLRELDCYGPLVTRGSYLIVEDTGINGHPIRPGWGAGPWEALEEWLPGHPEFNRDDGAEKFLLTFNPGGYLKRV